MSEEMRDAVHDAAARGARKKNDDAYAASEKTVNKMKRDIDRAAEKAAMPKDAEGNPIEPTGDASTNEAPADIPTAAARTAPTVSLDPAIAASGGAAPSAATTPRAVPKLNITV